MCDYFNPLERTFKGFCLFGSGGGKWELDGARFAKWCRECGLTGKGKCGHIGIDVVFSKCRSETGTRKVDYITLRGKVIPMLAKELKMTQNRVIEQLISISGPRDNSTHAASKRKKLQKVNQNHKKVTVNLPSPYPESDMFPFEPTPRTAPQQYSDECFDEYYQPYIDEYDDRYYTRQEYCSPPPPAAARVAQISYQNPQVNYSPYDQPDPRLSPLLPAAERLLDSTEYSLLHEAALYRRMLAHRDTLRDDEDD